MGIGMTHCLIRLLGGRIDRQRRIGLLQFAKGHIGIRAINRTGGCHQQMLHTLFFCEFHQIERAQNIRLDIAARIFQ